MIDYVADTRINYRTVKTKITSSDEDIQVTKRLKEAGKILGIELLDHIILVEDSFLSFKHEDLL